MTVRRNLLVAGLALAATIGFGACKQSEQGTGEQAPAAAAPAQPAPTAAPAQQPAQ